MASLLCFRVKCSSCFEDKVKICGNIPELGNWDPQLAFQLNTDSYSYPIWCNSEKLFLSQGVKLEFKVIIEKEDESIVWEAIDNRNLFVQYQKSVVFITFGNDQIQVIPLKFFKENEGQEDFVICQAKRVKVYSKINPLETQLDSNSEDESDIFSYVQSQSIKRSPQGDFLGENEISMQLPQFSMNPCLEYLIDLQDTEERKEDNQFIERTQILNLKSFNKKESSNDINDQIQTENLIKKKVFISREEQKTRDFNYGINFPQKYKYSHFINKYESHNYQKKK